MIIFGMNDRMVVYILLRFIFKMLRKIGKVGLPYVSYRTFRNFLELLSEGMPARIDRSVWGPRYSGTSGQQLMTALKNLDLIDDSGIPLKALEELVEAVGSERRNYLKIILKDKYKPIFEIDLLRATRSQFNEAFRSFGINEGVLSKCQLFFIQACQDAGIELSAYILARRHGLASRKKSEATTTKHNTQQKHDKLEINETIISKVLEKYPDFNPSWDPEVQKAWMEGMVKLYEGLKSKDKK